MRAIRRPGNVNIAPTMPQDTAMQNLTMIFDAGPLEKEIWNENRSSEQQRMHRNTHDELTPCPSRKLEALRLKLVYACSKPVSSVFSSTIKIIIEISKYVSPVTIHVDRSPIDSSLRKYWIVSDVNSLLENGKCEIRATINWYSDRHPALYLQ